MKDSSGFEYQAMIPPDYEGMIVEVLYKEEFLLLVSQEEGFERMRVAIHPRKDGNAWEFSMKELEAALKRAKDRLWDLRKTK